MPKSRGRKPKKKRAPASAPKKRLDNLNATPQELPLSTQPPQEPPPLATAPRQQQPTPKIKQIAKLTTAAIPPVTRQLQVFPVCNGSCCNKCTIMARRVGLSPCEVSSFFKSREKTL